MVLAKRPVKVTAVYPGGTKTSFIDSMGAAEHLGEVDLVSRYDKRAWTTSPERAAQVILRAVRRDQPRILIGPDTKILDLLVRLTGSAYQRVVPPMAARFVPPPAY
jgi:short-subunit dehydrogenase